MGPCRSLEIGHLWGNSHMLKHMTELSHMEGGSGDFFGFSRAFVSGILLCRHEPTTNLEAVRDLLFNAGRRKSLPMDTPDLRFI